MPTTRAFPASASTCAGIFRLDVSPSGLRITGFSAGQPAWSFLISSQLQGAVFANLSACAATQRKSCELNSLRQLAGPGNSSGRVRRGSSTDKPVLYDCGAADHRGQNDWKKAAVFPAGGH
jgi:hypothetical protein